MACWLAPISGPFLCASRSAVTNGGSHRISIMLCPELTSSVMFNLPVPRGPCVGLRWLWCVLLLFTERTEVLVPVPSVVRPCSDTALLHLSKWWCCFRGHFTLMVLLCSQTTRPGCRSWSTFLQFRSSHDQTPWTSSLRSSEELESLQTVVLEQGWNWTLQ